MSKLPYRELQKLCTSHKASVTVKCTSSAATIQRDLIRIGVLAADGSLLTDRVQPGTIYSDSYEVSTVLPLRAWDYYGKRGSKLGQGTFGVVRKYDSGVYGTSVAIKSSSETTFTTDLIPPPDVLIEIAVLKHLQHPNIVGIIDVVVHLTSTKLYVGIVQPLAQSDLKTYLKGVSVPLASKHKIVYNLLCGVAYIHSRHIIHRDIKPENVLVYANGDIRISDLGAAKPFACNPNNMYTNPVETLAYRAPEILLNDPEGYTFPADVWSLAATAWEVYAGRVLFDNTDDESGQIREIASILGSPDVEWPEAANFPGYVYVNIPTSPPNRDVINNGLPDDEIRRIINSMLVYDPELRPHAVGVVRDAYFDVIRIRENEASFGDCFVSHATRDRVTPTDETRIKYIDQLAKICVDRKYHIKTFLLSVGILNQLREVTTSHQVTACSSLAASISEYMTPSVDDFDDITAEELNTIRLGILRELNYDLLFTVAYDYHDELERFDAGEYWDLIKGLLVLSTTVSIARLPHDAFRMCVWLALVYYDRVDAEVDDALVPLTNSSASFVSDIRKIRDNDYKGLIDYYDEQTDVPLVDVINKLTAVI